jgi:hypothetical protein
MLPHRPQVLAQREPPVALLVAEREPTARQGGELCFHLRDMDEGVIPAPFSFARHQTVVRIAPIIWPSGPLGLVTRLFQGSFSGLPLRVRRPLDTLEREDCRLAPRGLEGLQHRRCHGLINTQAADRQAGRGAPVDPASPAHLPWHAPCGAARDDLERAAAAPAPQHATQQRRSPFGRAPGYVCWQSPLGLQALVVLEKHVPADGARMLLQQHDAPLLQWLFSPCLLPGTAIFDDGLGLGASIDQGSSIAWIGQHLVHTMATGQLPEDVVARRPRVDLGQRQLRITVPQHGLPGTPECATLLEHAI